MNTEYKIVRAIGTRRTYIIYKYEVVPYTFNLEYAWIVVDRISLI